MDYPILYTPDGKREAVLNGAYGIIVEDELLSTSGGYETLTFMMSNYDKKRRLLANEREIEVQGRRYIIRVVDDAKGTSNICTVMCDAVWYDLNDGELKKLMHDPNIRNFEYLGSRPLLLESPNMTGDDVLELQKYLNSSGHSCGSEDGIFGSKTEAGVKSFESEYRIVEDGVVDAEFVNLLRVHVFGEPSKITAYSSVVQQLEGTEWSVGTVDVDVSLRAHTSDNLETSLYNLRQVSGNFGGDLYFDTAARTVSLLKNLGIRHQKIFCYEKNTKSIKRTVDTRNLFTRFTLIGKDSEGNDVTVSDVNGGKDYVENYEWTDKAGLPRRIKWHRKVDERFSDKQNMLEYMKSWLTTYSKPVVSYQLDVSLFDISPSLGDYVYVRDVDLGIDGWLRVVARKKNVLQPELSTVQLESSKASIITTIVSSSATANDAYDIVSGVLTPDLELKLPAGTEDWIMQYKDGRWQASNVIGDINSLLDELNGEVT